MAGISLEIIPFVQIIIFLSSILYLCFTMKKCGLPIWVIVIFILSLALNVYYNAHHFSILTESLSLSAMNFLLAMIIRYVYFMRLKNIIFIGLIVGILAGLRPNLLALAPAIILIVIVINWRNLHQIFKHGTYFFLGFVVMILLENIGFYTHHTDRQSILPVILLGKTAMLTTDSAFVSPTLENKEEKELMSLLITAMAPVKHWRAQETNPIIKAIRMADYEIFAQFGLLNNKQTNPQGIKLTSQTVRSVGIKAIQTNFWPYLKLSTYHYLGLWSVHGLPFFASFTPKKIHKLFFDDGVEKGFDDSLLQFSQVVFPAFLLLGIFINGLGVYYFILVLSKNRGKIMEKEWTASPLLAMCLVIIILSVLVSTSLANISTPRYLMPVYPYAVLTFLLVFWSSLAWMNKKLRNH